jgi:hypothetical protein
MWLTIRRWALVPVGRFHRCQTCFLGHLTPVVRAHRDGTPDVFWKCAACGARRAVRRRGYVPPESSASMSDAPVRGA